MFAFPCRFALGMLAARKNPSFYAILLLFIMQRFYRFYVHRSKIQLTITESTFLIDMMMSSDSSDPVSEHVSICSAKDLRSEPQAHSLLPSGNGKHPCIVG